MMRSRNALLPAASTRECRCIGNHDLQDASIIQHDIGIGSIGPSQEMLLCAYPNHFGIGARNLHISVLILSDMIRLISGLLFTN
jgi:hypothetical protein